jgi:hypothetical protein
MLLIISKRSITFYDKRNFHDYCMEKVESSRCSRKKASCACTSIHQKWQCHKFCNLFAMCALIIEKVSFSLSMCVIAKRQRKFNFHAIIDRKAEENQHREMEEKERKKERVKKNIRISIRKRDAFKRIFSFLRFKKLAPSLGEKFHKNLYGKS